MYINPINISISIYLFIYLFNFFFVTDKHTKILFAAAAILVVPKDSLRIVWNAHYPPPKTVIVERNVCFSNRKRRLRSEVEVTRECFTLDTCYFWYSALLDAARVKVLCGGSKMSFHTSFYCSLFFLIL